MIGEKMKIVSNHPIPRVLEARILEAEREEEERRAMAEQAERRREQEEADADARRTKRAEAWLRERR